MAVPGQGLHLVVVNGTIECPLTVLHNNLSDIDGVAAVDGTGSIGCHVDCSRRQGGGAGGARPNLIT